jgi:hypothetical protein
MSFGHDRKTDNGNLNGMKGPCIFVAWVVPRLTSIQCIIEAYQNDIGNKSETDFMMLFIVDNDMRYSQRNETHGGEAASPRRSLQLSAS